MILWIPEVGPLPGVAVSYGGGMIHHIELLSPDDLPYQQEGSIPNYPWRIYLALRHYFQSYFRGTASPFPYRLNQAPITTFQKKVYDVVSTIGWGETRSYQWVVEQLIARGLQISRRVKGLYARAVGQALHVNRYPLVIPCHRVIRNDGAIGGFAKGTWLKSELITYEQSQVGF